MAPTQSGDFFLLPYTGSRRSRLVKAVQPTSFNPAQWHCSNESGHTSIVLLSSCHRCSPSTVDRILEGKKW